jgi:uncharacterized protein (DUF2252 family)
MRTPAERQAEGVDRRRVVRRVDQAAWAPAPTRADPVALIQTANAERLPKLVPIKMGRMATSPFSFFRGAAPVMAADLAALPTTGLRVQLCGDAHVQNIGAFAAPDGHLVFDLNDFDETIPGPWVWDLKRLAASFVLAGREAGAPDRACSGATRTLVASYREAMARFAAMTMIDLLRVEVKRHMRRGPVHDALVKAERVTPLRALERLTVAAGERRLFHDEPPLLEHVPDSTAVAVIASLRPYRDTLGPDRQLLLDSYEPHDVAFKVVGTGSVGTYDYVVLCYGAGPADPLILQIKEELASCYASSLPEASAFTHQGRRVAEGQHRMQTACDPLLGWTTLEGRDYLVRQLSDHKARVDTEHLRRGGLLAYATVAGEILAKGHARTGDAVAIAAYCGRTGKLDKAIARFATAYADQTEADHAQFVEAVRAGRIHVVPDRRRIRPA